LAAGILSSVGWSTSSQDLIYASLQARQWISRGGKARPNPAGRTEAVNLVYDRKRSGIVAINGAVKDFRPFIEAFRRAFTGEASDARMCNQAGRRLREM